MEPLLPDACSQPSSLSRFLARSLARSNFSTSMERPGYTREEALGSHFFLRWDHQMHRSLRRNFGNKMAAPMVLHPRCLLQPSTLPYANLSYASGSRYPTKRAANVNTSNHSIRYFILLPTTGFFYPTFTVLHFFLLLPCTTLSCFTKPCNNGALSCPALHLSIPKYSA